MWVCGRIMKKFALACFVLCGFAAPGIAADVPVYAPYQPPPVLRPLYSWTGCRIGVNIGGGGAPQAFTDTAGTFAPFVPGTSLGTHTSRGVAGGGQLGCDYQAGPVVFGIQGFYDLTGMKGNNLQPNGFFLNNSFLQSIATVTGRIGYTVTPTVLLYAKGGGAWVHDRYNVATPTGISLPLCAGTMMLPPCAVGVPTVVVAPGTILALGDHSATGWTAGLGAESALFGSNWSLFVEYNYLDFGTSRVTYTSTVVPGLRFPLDIRQSVNVVLFGLNYRFYSGAPWL
jgi:outer membrane immunogenic protein